MCGKVALVDVLLLHVSLSVYLAICLSAYTACISTLEVCSRRGAIQIHVYLYLSYCVKTSRC